MTSQREQEHNAESDRGRIKDLIERSSLGTPEAKALRATVSDEHAARIVALAKELETAEGVCDCALSLVGEHEDSCLHERLGRVERLLIELTRPTTPAESESAGGAQRIREGWCPRCERYTRTSDGDCAECPTTPGQGTYRPCAGCDAVGDSCRAIGCPATSDTPPGLGGDE